MSDFIEAVHLAKPGETIVVKFSPSVTPDRFHKMAEELEAKVSDGVKLLFLGGDIDVNVMATSEADRIAEAVRRATENPGKSFEVEQ